MSDGNSDKWPADHEHHETNGVKTLLGDPKKAILILSYPMILAMLVQTSYNLVNAVWVSGLGPNALASVGFFFPFFFMLMALATGLGTGGGAAISRRIGAKDKKCADDVASHTIIMMILLAIAVTIPFFVFTRQIFVGIGAGDVIDDTVAYAQIMFAGTFIIFFVNVANALLRGEGDARRSMFAMLLGGVLNIILDPIFIFGPDSPGPGGLFSFGLGMGVAGAAVASLLAMSVSAILLFYWLFMKKDTFVTFRFRGFRFKKPIARDIFQVGVPSAILQLSMSINMLVLNIILVSIEGDYGVAVFTTGWRVTTMFTLPIMGISTAVMSVCGAMYGRKDVEKLDIGFMYAIKIGLIIEAGGMLFTFILAPQITALFTSSPDSATLATDLIHYLRLIFLFYPGVVLGMLASAMFQGIGKGMNSLLITLVRTVILTPPFVLLFAYSLDMGLTGVWLGLVVANLIGSTAAFVWARMYVNRLKKSNKINAIV